MINFSWIMSLGRFVRHDILLECIAAHVEAIDRDNAAGDGNSHSAGNGHH